MNFKSVSIVKFPVELTWNTMIHYLPQIASGVDELESVVEQERIKISPGVTNIVSIWKAKPKLPEFILKHIKSDMLSWTDAATWLENDKKIEWKITSHFLKNVENEGNTLFEPAMGGKGCRLTFSGSLVIREDNGSSGFGILTGTILKAAEGIIAQMIPSNFRKLAEALGKYMEHNITLT